VTYFTTHESDRIGFVGYLEKTLNDRVQARVAEVQGQARQSLR